MLILYKDLICKWKWRTVKAQMLYLLEKPQTIDRQYQKIKEKIEGITAETGNWQLATGNIQGVS